MSLSNEYSLAKPKPAFQNDPMGAEVWCHLKEVLRSCIYDSWRETVEPGYPFTRPETYSDGSINILHSESKRITPAVLLVI